MGIDILNITLMSNEQIVNLCHDATAKPVLIMSYLFSIILLGFFGFFIEGEKSKKKFYLIWIFFVIIFGAFMAVLYFIPNSVTQNVVEFFESIF